MTVLPLNPCTYLHLVVYFYSLKLTHTFRLCSWATEVTVTEVAVTLAMVTGVSVEGMVVVVVVDQAILQDYRGIA